MKKWAVVVVVSFCLFGNHAGAQKLKVLSAIRQTWIGGKVIRRDECTGVNYDITLSCEKPYSISLDKIYIGDLWCEVLQQQQHPDRHYAQSSYHSLQL
jgi:hypothetical protein